MSQKRDGYQNDFLGENHIVPLPVPSLEIEDDVLIVNEETNQSVVDYVHYSVVMSKSNQQALFSAANIDQDLYRKVKGRNWFVDPRIGWENQIGPEAYKRNPWDRGHLTRRAAIAWGKNDYIAKSASNDSCSYANASLQHENFNQDEWRVPEEVVHHFGRDKNNRLCVFTGPVFSQTDRWYTRRSMGIMARIPSGFWKMIVYIDAQTDDLATQAFVMFQDEQFMMDKQGRDTIHAPNYQVTTTELELLTGLDFGEALYNRNPLYFHPHEGENEGPERFRTPESTAETDLSKGIVISREDISEEMKKRKRELQGNALDELINNVWFA